MKFIDYVFLREMGEIATADTSAVEFKSVSGVLVSTFTASDGEEYYVQFRPSSNYGLEGVSISFRGPSGYNLTNKSIAFEVYSKMLLSVKKYIELYKPDILKFIGYHDSMDLVYDRFVNKFLGDAPGKDPNFVFIRLNSQYYIKKSAYEQLSGYDKQHAQQDLQKWGDKNTPGTDAHRYFSYRRQGKQAQSVQKRNGFNQQVRPLLADED